MAKRRPILHEGDNRVFKTMADAEREYGIAPGTISYSINYHKPIPGHVFRYADEVSEDSGVPEDVPTPEVKDDTEEVIRIPSISRERVIELLEEKHMDVADVEGVVMFFEVDPDSRDELAALLDELGYHCSWGYTKASKETYLSKVSKYTRNYTI